MKILTLLPDNDPPIQQAAQLLVDAFREHWLNAWPTLMGGTQGTARNAESERICRAAVDEQGRLMGIIGGIPAYDGHVWELHPRSSAVFAGQGIGKALVEDFRGTGSRQGRLTITLGSDDEDNMTSLSGVDLYENLWEKKSGIFALKIPSFWFLSKDGIYHYRRGA